MERFIKLSILILIFFFTYGCIQEETFPYESSQLISQEGIDINEDGQIDAGTYYYQQIEAVYDKGNIKVERNIYVRPYIFSVEAEGPQGTKAFIEGKIKSIEKDIENSIKDCRKLYCITPAECRSKTPDDGTSLIALSLSNLIRDIDNQNKPIARELLRLEETNNTSLLYNEIAKKVILAESLKNHPAVKLGLCNVKELPNTGINITSLNIEKSEYVETITIENEGKLTLKLKINEIVPITLSEGISSIRVSNGEIKNRLPLEISSIPINVNPYQTLTLSTSFISSTNPDKTLMEKWKNVEITVKILRVNIPVVEGTLEMLNNIFKTIKPQLPTDILALSLALSTITAILLLLEWIISFILTFFSLFLKGKNLSYSLKIAIGYIDIAWKRKLIVGLLLIIIPLAWELTNYPKEITELNSSSLRNLLTTLPDSAIFLSYFIGIYLILYVIRDRLRALMGGTISSKEKRSIIEKIEKKKMLIKELYNELSSKGIEVSEEYQTIIKIPKTLINYNIEKLKKIEDEVEKTLNSLKNKKETAEKQLPIWEAYISEMLENNNTIAIDSLIAIPQPFRMWAINHYIEKHPEENVVIEGNTIKKIELSEDEKLNIVVKKYLDNGKVNAVIVLKDGKVKIHKSTTYSYGVKVILYYILKLLEGEELFIKTSKEIIYAKKGPKYWAIAAGEESKSLVEKITKI